MNLDLLKTFYYTIIYEASDCHTLRVGGGRHLVAHAMVIYTQVPRTDSSGKPQAVGNIFG